MSTLIPFDPFAELQALQKQFFGDDWFTPVKGIQTPMTDIYTKDGRLIVEAHLPKFTDKDVDIRVDKNILEIQAEKHEKEEDKEKKYVVRESSSSFYRRIRLPERADESAIEAHMQDGVLRVVVPLKELPEPRRIHVNGGKGQAKLGASSSKSGK